MKDIDTGHVDTVVTCDFSDDLEDLSDEEKYKILFTSIIAHRVTPDLLPIGEIEDIGEEEYVANFRQAVDDLATRFAQSPLFIFYLGQDILPEEDPSVYNELTTFFKNHSGTASSVIENFHHEAYVRFRRQDEKHTASLYGKVIEELGAEDEVFEGDARTPYTINYNRSLVTNNFKL